jgi:hypothetical protein
VKVLPHVVKGDPPPAADLDPARYEVVANSLATTLLMRRRAFAFVGGWPEGWAYREHPGGCEDIALQDLFAFCFNVGLIGQPLYNHTHRQGNALDCFLARSSVEDGKVVFHWGVEEDRKTAVEGRRLREQLRQRVRAFLVERLGEDEAYVPPSQRPAGFARLEGQGEAEEGRRDC